MKQSIINIILSLAKQSGCRFASVTYKSKGTGEIAKHRLLLGVNLERAYRRDLSVMRRQLPRCKTPLETEACNEIIASLKESLDKGIGNNSAYTQKGQWETIIPGLRQDTGNGTLQVYGFSRGKTVITPGIYKHVNSSSLTIAKKLLRKRLKIDRFRPFVLDNIQNARVNGNIIELE